MKFDLPFDIGVPVWKATYQYTEERVVCPECNGDLTVTVTQGNGEAFKLPCRCCDGDIMTPPRGYIVKRKSNYIPVSFTPFSWGKGPDLWFSESYPEASSYTITYAKDLFKDFTECVDRCAALNFEQDTVRANQEYQHLHHRRKDYAWSAHYWRSKRNSLRKELEYIDARLVQIAERKK